MYMYMIYIYIYNVYINIYSLRSSTLQIKLLAKNLPNVWDLPGEADNLLDKILKILGGIDGLIENSWWHQPRKSANIYVSTSDYY